MRGTAFLNHSTEGGGFPRTSQVSLALWPQGMTSWDSSTVTSGGSARKPEEELERLSLLSTPSQAGEGNAGGKGPFFPWSC